jgi:hypothetical protein
MKAFYLNKSAFDLKINFIQNIQLFHLVSLICEFLIMSDLKNKNKKRTCSFNKSWLSSNEFKEWLAIAEDDGHAKCLVCNSIFSIKSGGISDVKRHSEGALHRKNINSKTQNKAATKSLITPDLLKFKVVHELLDHPDTSLLLTEFFNKFNFEKEYPIY